jgi:tetratricopeptide (TPR) repeat protein
MPSKLARLRSKAPKQLFTDNSIAVEEISMTSDETMVEPQQTLPIQNVFNIALNTPFQITGKNLCLNMIVRNESKIIKRLLESVVKYIDCYCICDTGSTDNTIEIIQTFFSSQTPPIPGRIIQEPFRDFGYNRTFSLKACEEIDAKYVLLLDADMVFQVNPLFSKEDLYSRLTEDAYYVFQGSDTFYYKNVRIVKNRIGMTYWGVTHEYVNTPKGTKYEKLEKDDVFINDIGDGGCKADKFVRDINLLKKGLEQEPNNDRYTFYLANSYRDAGQYENAIDTYKKRIEIGGWFDEVWHSHYSIGKCYKNMGDMANAIYWWLEAYNFYPNRIENLYEIIHHYRCIGKNQLAYGIYLMADHERNKNTHNDYLFLQKDIYDYKLDYELSIIGYYCNYKNIDLKQTSLKVLNYPFVDEGIARNTLSNYKFYSNSIVEHNCISNQNKNILSIIGYSIPEIQMKLGEFKKSTPSICINKEGDLVVNTRFVNYRIDEEGKYRNVGNIASINIVTIIDIENEEWSIIKEFVLNYETKYDNLYIGLEDIRLFTHTTTDAVYFNANRGLSYHNIQIEHGTIDMVEQRTRSGFIKMEGQHEVEKNWLLFEDANGKMKIIYNWAPLVIGDIEPGNQGTPSEGGEESKTFVKTHNIETPHFFKHIRGSTNGVRVGDEIWFICHTVSYEDRRYYYHIFIALDATTYEVKRYTPYFTFQKEKVEYTLGFVYFEPTQEIMIGYSIMDCQTEYMLLDKSIIENMMYQIGE